MKYNRLVKDPCDKCGGTVEQDDRFDELVCKMCGKRWYPPQVEGSDDGDKELEKEWGYYAGVAYRDLTGKDLDVRWRAYLEFVETRIGSPNR